MPSLVALKSILDSTAPPPQRDRIAEFVSLVGEMGLNEFAKAMMSVPRDRLDAAYNLASFGADPRAVRKGYGSHEPCEGKQKERCRKCSGYIGGDY
jgi:hypothetical protein